jgi:hypothetical protein
MAKGTFKTSFLQRIIILDADVVSAAVTDTLEPMQLVTVAANAGDNSLFNISAAADLATATHMIAQGDIALKAIGLTAGAGNANAAYAHIPAENGIYRIIKDTVKATVTAAPSTTTTTWKKVAVYKLFDKDDIREVN